MIHRGTHASLFSTTAKACRRLVQIAGVSLLLCAAASAQTTWHVDDDAVGDPGPGNPAIGDPSEDGSAAHPFDAVQEAINAASNGDTVLIHDGAYIGVGNFALDPAGKAILIRSENGPGQSLFSIGGGMTFAVLDDGETASTVFEGLGLSGTSAFNSMGIVLEGAGVTIRGCEFHDFGESVLSGPHSGDVLVEDSAIHHCGAGFDSLPVINLPDADTLELRNCAISQNRVNAVRMTGGALIMSDCVLERNRNSLDTPGGLWVTADSVRIARCDFLRNTAGVDGPFGSGGAISCSSPDALVVNCRFLANLANANSNDFTAFGGAIRSSGSLRVQNCVFAGNRAGRFVGGDGRGGAIYAEALTLENSTFVNNSGIGRFDTAPIEATALVAHNCIVQEARGIVAGAATITYSNVRGGASGDGNIDDDPLFVDEDGPDGDPNAVLDNDYHLSSTSPSIDAGDNLAVPADETDLDLDNDSVEPLPLDLDDQPRFQNNHCVPDTGAGLPPLVDMGAYEFVDSPGLCECPGDLNGDHQVDLEDLATALAAYGLNPSGDLDGDGDTDLEDLTALLAAFGESCG